MPFIKGRFHINPIAGQALEAAREAEAALLALEHAAQQERQGDSYGAGDPETGASSNYAGATNEAPIHRVEIEASELVPAHQGRAVRGYVARVHRHPAVPAQPGSYAQQDEFDTADSPPYRGAYATAAPRSSNAAPETHVFADHRDLVSFLRDELAKDCK
jgi:hypothetical protein